MPRFPTIFSKTYASHCLVAALILVFSAVAVEARESATPWDSTDVSDIRLISAQDALGNRSEEHTSELQSQA